HILAIDENKISINDEFFQLGGNSILAIQLMSDINKTFNAKLKIVDIFIYNTINLLKNQIILTKSYMPIVKINHATQKPNLFMIHPGGAGSEVYLNLAEKLSNQFGCFGVESYNLYHHEKIDTLKGLSTLYLKAIKEVMDKTGQDHYYIAG